MWGGIIGLVIQLIAGAVGGNVAGATLKQDDLGMIGNTIAGIVGGGVGAQVMARLLGAAAREMGANDLDIGSIVGQIASGGVGGSILMVIVGLIKQAMGGQIPAGSGVGLPTGCQGLNGCGRDTPWHLRTRAWSWSQ